MNRILLQLRSMLFFSGTKRANWLRKKHIFGHIGTDVMIQDYKLPFNPELVFIGNNVRFASNVVLITHDVTHHMLNILDSSANRSYKEKTGKIIIGNNVFIGANTTILYDVTIGNNVIVGAGSIVTKDLPDNSVCVGNPCKKIDEFNNFVKKRKLYSSKRI